MILLASIADGVQHHLKQENTVFGNKVLRGKICTSSSSLEIFVILACLSQCDHFILNEHSEIIDCRETQDIYSVNCKAACQNLDPISLKLVDCCINPLLVMSFASQSNANGLIHRSRTTLRIWESELMKSPFLL